MKEIEIAWDKDHIQIFKNGWTYIINNSLYLSDKFLSSQNLGFYDRNLPYWTFEKNIVTGHNEIPKSGNPISLTELREQYIVGIYEEISYEYLEKVLENKVKSHQVILSGKVTQESVAKYSSEYGVQVEEVECFDCQAWITSDDDDMLEEARGKGVKIRRI